jgi:hypothetical protein
MKKRFITPTKYVPRIFKESNPRIKSSNVVIRVIAALMIAGGIILTSIGISLIYFAPSLSDFKATFPGNQTNPSSQTIPIETIGVKISAWILFIIGLGLLVTGVLLKT